MPIFDQNFYNNKAPKNDISQEKSDKIWLKNYNSLVNFIKKFGHQKFPVQKTSPNYCAEFKLLSSWAYLQRKEYKMGTLEDWKYDLLVKVNFIFNPDDTYWNNRFEELIQFKKEFGHCNVPYRYKKNPELSSWVSNQRTYFAKLSDERIKMLNEIGFKWKFMYKKKNIEFDWQIKDDSDETEFEENIVY
ncbi:MAG: box helicase [Ignavibacteria bacterium]|nr:box helicase [Ignavibacteria bacterium]